MNQPILPPPPLPPKSFIRFTFNNGTTISSRNAETIKAVVEEFESMPAFDKKSAYFVVDNRVVFLENVDTIHWYLDEEETG